MTPPASGRVVVLSGPSGVGKGTVIGHLRRLQPDLEPVVSVTTRPPRPGERDGVDYRFVDDAAFDRLVAEGALLEWATYGGHRYGTPAAAVAEIQRRGRLPLLEIDVQGARQIRQRLPDAVLIMLVPPSEAELERRLRRRGTEDDDTIAARLRAAREELAQRDLFDLVVVNDDPERCAQRIADLLRRVDG